MEHPWDSHLPVCQLALPWMFRQSLIVLFSSSIPDSIAVAFVPQAHQYHRGRLT
jgi:hypothetical protein